MLTVGVDIIEISRVQRVLARWGERFLNHLYTANEVALCRGRTPALAVRFAAKEAVMKALGTGTHGVGWRDIEILADSRGKPWVQLHGRAEARAGEQGTYDLAVSLSHSREYAVAVVIGSVA